MAFEFVYCPLSELPHDADPTIYGGKYGYGTDVFGGSNDWIIYENNTNPVRIYKLPVPVSRLVRDLFEKRFEMGKSSAQEDFRKALGLK